MSRLTGRQGYFSYFSTKKLLRRIKKIRPDIVHLRVLHSNCLHIPTLLTFLAKNNIPTVLTLHDCWFFTGHCCYFIDANCNRWTKQCGHCPELHAWNQSWFFDRTRNNLVDKKELFSKINRLAVIGVSDWVTNFIKDSILKNATIVERIYNWIDIETFKPTKSNIREKLGLESDFIVLGVAQNWGIQKGIDDIIIVAEQLPEYKFWLIGNISKNYFPLPANVRIIGTLSSVRDLVEYYSTADVFFNPSTRETFGKVTVEALSCGTPVVAYNLTATPELVRSDCGFIVEQGDYNAVIEALKTVRMKGKEKYSDSCRRFAVSNFSSTKLMSDYLDLYQRLL